MNNPQPLTDRHRRRINYLRISVTDRCNLRCRYCMPEEGVPSLRHEDVLSYEEFLRVARVAVRLGIEKIRVTGGEPLVRRGIEAFLARLSALEGLRDLALTTNGVLLAERVEALQRAGLRRVNVSLDTLRPDRFEHIARRPGLERVLAGIRAARDAGLRPVKVNVVAMRGVNEDEILDFAAFARDEGVEVRFIEFMPAGADWEEARVVPAREILEVLSTLGPLVPRANGSHGGPSRVFELPGGGTVGVISPLSDHFCGSCNRMRITAEGKLRTCLFSRDEIDLRLVLRSGTDDAELARVLRDAVSAKPPGHGIAAAPDGPRDRPFMHKVGG
ncbi:GTP 3',8-cyclase MoaA [Deferrisoma sp.]